MSKCEECGCGGGDHYWRCLQSPLNDITIRLDEDTRELLNQITPAAMGTPIAPREYARLLLRLMFFNPEQNLSDIAKRLGITVEELKDRCFPQVPNAGR